MKTDYDYVQMFTFQMAEAKPDLQETFRPTPRCQQALTWYQQLYQVNHKLLRPFRGLSNSNILTQSWAIRFKTHVLMKCFVQKLFHSVQHQGDHQDPRGCISPHPHILSKRRTLSTPWLYHQESLILTQINNISLIVLFKYK